MQYKNIFLSKNRIEVNIPAADAMITDRSDLEYYLEIFIPNGYLSNDYISLIKLQASEVPPYDNAGIMIYEGAYFPIEEYLDGLLEYTPPKFDQKTVSECEKLCMPYYLKKTIKNNEIEIFEEITNVEYVLKGGINERDIDWKDFLFTNQNGMAGKFLTWAPDGKVLQPNQQEYIYWLTNALDMPSAMMVSYEMILANGSYGRAGMLHLIEDVLPFTVYCIPINPSLNLLHIDIPWEEYSGFRIKMSLGDDAIYSETRTYYIDKRYRRNLKQIMYSNSLGGFDTLTLFGKSSETIMVIGEESERYLPFGANATFSERVINRITAERIIEINTGYITIEELKYFQDLLFAKQIYLITDRELLPLVNTSTEFSNNVDDEYVRGRTFVFKYANNEYSYSKLLPPPKSAIRPTEWRVFGNYKCISNTNGIWTGYAQYSQLKKYYVDNGQPVVPIEIKNNKLGTEGYKGPVMVASCGITPFYNKEYKAQINYTKNDCNNTLSIGTKPYYIVYAGRYGSDISQAEADAKAYAEWVANNNQESANLLGICRTTGWRGYGTPVCLQNSNGLNTGMGIFPQLERYYLDDNSAVVPAQIKSNVSTDANYIGAVAMSYCSATKYLNTAISRLGTKIRNNCATGYDGTAATITVTAGLFGSNISQADANSKAEAYFATLDTQTLANNNGSCLLSWINGGLWSKWWNIAPVTQEIHDSSPPIASNFQYGQNVSHIFNFDKIDGGRYGGYVPSGVSDTYFVRAIGQIKLPAGNITATIGTDDGVKVVINGNVALNSWKGQWEDHDISFYSTGGWMDIIIEQYNDQYDYYFVFNNFLLNGVSVTPELRYKP